MAEVEIISMLMSALASTSNMVAVTPGSLFMPAPMIDTLAMSGSATTDSAPSSGAWVRHSSSASSR
jgi:hypothetical protein